MTPAQQALAEAAALETARVYSTTCPEYRPIHTTSTTRPSTVDNPRPTLRLIHPNTTEVA